MTLHLGAEPETSHYLKQRLPNLPMNTCSTRGTWVNGAKDGLLSCYSKPHILKGIYHPEGVVAMSIKIRVMSNLHLYLDLYCGLHIDIHALLSIYHCDTREPNLQWCHPVSLIGCLATLIRTYVPQFLLLCRMRSSCVSMDKAIEWMALATHINISMYMWLPTIRISIDMAVNVTIYNIHGTLLYIARKNQMRFWQVYNFSDFFFQSDMSSLFAGEYARWFCWFVWSSRWNWVGIIIILFCHG